ncbi:MAG: hypothetical protein JOZ65_21645 [Chloroflexi bacterium]|nr:hypothetical protein [Chloroflexota bacterium]
MLQRPVQVVLFTNRPSVSAFFEAHSARIGADVSFALMPLDDSSVDASAQRVQHADSVIVDIGSHPDTGVRLCAGLRSRWPELRVLAIVCCWQPTLAWHIQQLIASRVDEVLDAQASPADIFAAAQGDHEARAHSRSGRRT